MFGFVVGTICLILLIKMARVRRRIYAAGCGGYARSWGWHGWHGGHAWHGGWHGHGWHGHGWHGHGGVGFRGGPLRWLFEELQTTPGQEKAIVAAIEELKSVADAARGEWPLTRKDLAAAFTAPSFDAEHLGHTFARHDDTLRDVRKAIVGALAKIHDALDEKQRARLADLLERGLGSGFFHPYR
jgi:hypothetical protein